MGNRRLSTAEDIELVNQEFKNERWERAAQEILAFWDEGITSFLGMSEEGEWSRTFYSDVFDEHFQAYWPDEHNISASDDALSSLLALPVEREQALEIYRQLYRDIYGDAFRDGVKWARNGE